MTAFKNKCSSNRGLNFFFQHRNWKNWGFVTACRGFTLLEVMISISIIAFIFVSVFRMQSSTINLALANKFNSIAPVLAEKLLNEVVRDLAKWSQFEGDFGEDFPGIQWRMEISHLEFDMDDFIDKENMAKFKKIQIEIFNLSGSNDYKVTTWRVAE